MEESTATRWDYKFVVVSLVCAIGAVAGSYMLWRDFNESGATGQGAPMGKVEHRESKVRRKTKSSYIWSNVQINESLYRKDSIQTAEGSAAAIRLKDGTLLEMGENSLVVLDEVGDLSLNFLRGQMVLRKTTGDTRVSVGRDGQAKIEELPIRLVKPRPLGRIFTSSLKPMDVRFEWELRDRDSSVATQSYRVEVSTEPEFRPGAIKQLESVASDARSASVKLPPGRYYWRVVSNGHSLTETGQFKIVSIEPIKTAWPNAGQKALSIGSERSLQFRWASVSQSENDETIEHFIEVSRDAQFSDLVRNEKIAAAAGAANIKGLDPGKYYWRVRTGAGDAGVFSRPQAFVVEQAQSIDLALSAPLNEQALARGKPVRFNWSSSALDAEYQWDFETLQGKSVFSRRLRSSSIEWKNPNPGFFRWKVSAFTASQKIAETQWRTLSVFEGDPIDLGFPSRGQKINYWEKPAEFEFEWSDDELLSSKSHAYVVELARDIDFKEISSSVRTSANRVSHRELQFTPGSYFWRVRIVDAENRTVKASEVGSFDYGPFPTLRAPASAQPDSGTVFNLLEQETEPTLTWAAVEGALGYEVTLTKAREQTAVLKKVTQETTLSLKSLEPGHYAWTVRTIDRVQRRGEPMIVHSLVITHGDPLPAPEALSPEVQ
ncbi:MAG: hypothetical protein AB1540_09430 [Bdellovibrionota bacterium]